MEAFEAGATLGMAIGGCLVYLWHLLIMRNMESSLFEERATGIAEGLSFDAQKSPIKKEIPAKTTRNKVASKPIPPKLPVRLEKKKSNKSKKKKNF